MIVWGGYNDDFSGGYLASGGQYDPAADSWISTSMTNAPSRRTDLASSWSGSDMLVWGGYFSSTRLDSGGRYTP